MSMSYHEGKMNDDIRLQEGDVIIVNPYESLVEIVGKVKRPMYYEMKLRKLSLICWNMPVVLLEIPIRKPFVLSVRADVSIRFSM